MRKQAAIWLAFIVLAVGAFAWYKFLSYANVDVRKEMSGEGISSISLELRDVDLIIQKSPDRQITARLSGEKAKADRWTLDTYVQGPALQIESLFAQRAYLNYKDNPKRVLILSLPEKQYDSIRLKFSSEWRKSSLKVQMANGELQAVNLKKLKNPGYAETPFGNIRIQIAGR